ncbi:MAG TPA: hypothetical protein VNG35_16535 [Gemmatimonadales bacterium]|nr:hypothetical protein [Gemmatimonadales bacterium]
MSREQRFVAAVVATGCTQEQADRALVISRRIGANLKAQLGRVRSKAARERILCAGNALLTAQISDLLADAPTRAAVN